MKNLIQRKKTKHTPSGYSLFTYCSFDATTNKPDCYKGKDCMEKFYKDLRDHAMKIINCEEKEMIPLTDKEYDCYEKQKLCCICKKEYSTDENDKNAFKLYHKVRDYCHYAGKFRRAAHSICNLKCKTPKEIPVVFHNGSRYDYHFIINKLAKEFYGQLECLGQNTEKYTLQYQLVKNLIMIKQLRTVQSLLIALDLCRPHYQVLLIIYLKNFIVISVKIVNLNLIICQSKIIN